MKKLIILGAILLFSISSYGEELKVFSCDRQHSLKQESPRELIIVNKNKRNAKVKITHEIYGGAIDSSTSTFVVYGSPFHLSNDNPQLMVVSIYKNMIKPRLYMRRYLGGGIYGVNFSKDHQYIVANTRFGDFVANVRTGQSELRSPSEPVAVAIADCR